MLTFLTGAQHRQLEISGYESKAEGMVENLDGKYRVTRITVQPTVSLDRESDVPLAREVFESAKEGCFISNSVVATVDLSPQFKTGNGCSVNELAISRLRTMSAANEIVLTER